jgi:RNA polymerase sigma factor (sigma-70 family)
MNRMMDDAELLCRYAASRAEDAFAELVRRHVNLVYRAALRQCGGDAHRADDVTQLVFTLLARKAPTLARHPSLTGWLYTTTHFTVRDVHRTERRRALREKEALIMQEPAREETTAADWERLRPVLDDAMQKLAERDRIALLRRFFEGRSFAQIAAGLSLTEDAARMRVERALEKLRALLARRGVTSTSAALGLMLTSEAAIAAPASMAASVTGSALAMAASGAGVAPAFTLLEFMTTSKIAAGGAALVLALTLGTAVHEVRAGREGSVSFIAAQQAHDTLAARLRDLQQRAAAADHASLALRQSVERARVQPIAAPRPATMPTTDERLAKGHDFMARHPDVQRLFVDTWRAELAGQHAPLFKLLQLSPAQIEQFKDLALQGIRGIMTGADGLPMLYQIEGDRQAAQIQLRALLGEDGFRQYANPGALNSAWRTATELGGALYGTTTPLSAEQARKMMQLLNAGSMADEGPTRNRRDWDAIMPQAEQVLSPPQLAALSRIKANEEIGRTSDEIRRQQRASPAPNSETSTPKK